MTRATRLQTFLDMAFTSLEEASIGLNLPIDVLEDLLDQSPDATNSLENSMPKSSILMALYNYGLSLQWFFSGESSPFAPNDAGMRLWQLHSTYERPVLKGATPLSMEALISVTEAELLDLTTKINQRQF